MRICPICKAEVNDFDSVCDYCGSELDLNIEFENAMSKAEEFFNALKRMSESACKLTNSDLKKYDEALSFVENVKSNYAESSRAQKILYEILKLEPAVSEKIKNFKKSQYRKTKALTVILSIIAEMSILFLLVLISVFNPEDVKTWAVSIPALICALIGAGLSSDSGYLWGGFFAGMFVGGIIGYLIFLLIATPIGQLIFLVAGTVGLIVGTVCRIRGAKKKWH